MIVQILDVGCGEGDLLTPLCQPAPWLPPPPDRLPPPSSGTTSDKSGSPASPNFNNLDGIPELHPSLIHGLDVSPADLEFAIERTRPSGLEAEFDPANPPPRTYTINLTRFEPLDVKLWEGGLEVINEEFVGIECIVSTEVYVFMLRGCWPRVDPLTLKPVLNTYHPPYTLSSTLFSLGFTTPLSSLSRPHHTPSTHVLPLQMHRPQSAKDSRTQRGELKESSDTLTTNSSGRQKSSEPG